MLKFSPMNPKTVLMRLPFRLALLSAATLALCAPSALADTVTSSNWAGYAVHRSGVRFTKVLGSWRQPGVSCGAGIQTYSAVWIGLGGYNQNSGALEQIGSEVDCTASGRVSSSVWYELVPAPSESIRMHVRPGDALSASVSVSGHRVTVALNDLSAHHSFHKTITSSAIDISSAEWIVEAPSECVSADACETLPLANFGSATFTLVQARSTNGHTGAISDSNWGATKIKLTASGRRFAIYQGSGAAAGTATPSALSSRGKSFRVVFSTVALQANPFLRARQPTLRAGYLVHPGR
jgi:Peptidase A4 family